MSLPQDQTIVYESPIPTIRYNASVEASITRFNDENKENLDPNGYIDYFKHPDLPKKLRRRSNFKLKSKK